MTDETKLKAMRDLMAERDKKYEEAWGLSRDLYELMEESGLSSADIARGLGITRQAVHLLRKRHRANPGA